MGSFQVGNFWKIVKNSDSSSLTILRNNSADEVKVTHKYPQPKMEEALFSDDYKAF